MKTTTITTINPATGEEIASYPIISDDAVEQALASGYAAFQAWSRVTRVERTELVRRLGKALRAQEDQLATLMATEMGKPLSQCRGEVQKCSWLCEYFAEHGPGFLEPQQVETDNHRSYIAFEPLGPVLAIMPWNFPLWQVLRFAVPALIAGNSVLFKHAECTMGCGDALHELFRSIDAPNGLFQHVIVSHDQVSRIIADQRLFGVTLTGSTRAGRALASQAGQALKKTVLELGGSDPFVVLADADLEAAAQTAVNARLANCGQSCISPKRLIVEAEVHDEFVARLRELVAEKSLGDPMEDATDVGPMAREDLRAGLHEQVLGSIKAGATCLAGGRFAERNGWFYEPTLLTDVGPGMPAYDDELFGPVLAVVKAVDEKDAIRIANDTVYGLGAVVFTRDLLKGERIALHELRAGCCFVNDFTKSDPRLPFGGIGDSGYGRELSAFGIHEFVNIKTVVVK